MTRYIRTFMTLKTFDDRWKIWIWTNISRGCDKDGIFKILSENGFDYDAIKQELNYEPAVALDEIKNPLKDQDPAQPQQPIFVANSNRIDNDKVELYTLEDFLTADECHQLIEIMRPALRPSKITNDDEPDAYFRTSKTCDFAHINHPFPTEINLRICRTLGISPSYSEAMQGQLYDVGEEFKAHTDWFTPGTDEFARFGAERGQRSWTFMIYLNDVESGGETSFSKIGELFTPKAGTAVFWNNIYPDGSPNPNTLHHALPVKAGYKAIVTKWFRVGGVGDMNIKTDAERIPNFTRVGFKKLEFPDAVYQPIREYLEQHWQLEKDETQALNYLANQSMHPTGIIELPVELKQLAAEAIRPLIEEWAGQELAFTCVYGIRRYHRGTTLSPHRDRVDTHILSAIVNIEQDVEEDWPLEIEDNSYRSHKVYLSPGEMLLYESARLIHGRMTPLKGNSFSNLFIHFTPASDDWKSTNLI